MTSAMTLTELSRTDPQDHFDRGHGDGDNRDNNSRDDGWGLR